MSDRFYRGPSVPAQGKQSSADTADDLDREQIAALLFVTRYQHISWLDASAHETATAYKQADQIIALVKRSEPQQSAETTQSEPVPNNDSLSEMLEGARTELRKAAAKIAKLEVEKNDLTDIIWRQAQRLEARDQSVMRSEPQTLPSPAEGEVARLRIDNARLRDELFYSRKQVEGAHAALRKIVEVEAAAGISVVRRIASNALPSTESGGAT